MMNCVVLYNFTGNQVDRSTFDVEFDGANLSISVDDQSRDGGIIRLKFSWACNFCVEGISSLLSTPDNSYEKLIQEDADEFLRARKALFGRFMDERTKKFSVFFTDIGSVLVYAREVEITHL